METTYLDLRLDSSLCPRILQLFPPFALQIPLDLFGLHVLFDLSGVLASFTAERLFDPSAHLLASYQHYSHLAVSCHLSIRTLTLMAGQKRGRRAMKRTSFALLATASSLA
jgi:hypothetical protein